MFDPGGGRPRGLLLAGEHETWMLTVGQSTAHGEPPADFAAMFAAAEPALPPAICHGLRGAQPIGEVITHHHTAAVWRRYDRMPRFPSGLLVLGDAVCSLDPSYGQGMTIAALQALTLRDCLGSGETQLAQRFFGAAARYIGATWAGNQIRDRIDAPVGRARRRAGAWTARATLNAAANDVVLTERLLRVLNLVDPPGRLQDPVLLPRIALGNVRGLFARRRGEASRAASPQPGTPVPAIAGC